MKRKILLVSVIFVILLSVSANSRRNSVSGGDPIMKLVFDARGGSISPHFGLFIAQYLRDIGIELEVKVQYQI